MFFLNMGVTERDAETTIETICSNFFLVSNLRSFEFTNCSGKSIIILDLDEHPVDLTYCTFRSVVSIIKVDDRVSGKTLSIDCSSYATQFCFSLTLHWTTGCCDS